MVSSYRGPAQDMGISSVSHSVSGRYNSRSIHSKQADVFQYDGPSHVWKKWLMMRNMCKPVDHRRSFADVFKKDLVNNHKSVLLCLKVPLVRFKQHLKTRFP